MTASYFIVFCIDIDVNSFAPLVTRLPTYLKQRFANKDKIQRDIPMFHGLYTLTAKKIYTRHKGQLRRKFVSGGFISTCLMSTRGTAH